MSLVFVALFLVGFPLQSEAFLPNTIPKERLSFSAESPSHEDLCEVSNHHDQAKQIFARLCAGITASCLLVAGQPCLALTTVSSEYVTATQTQQTNCDTSNLLLSDNDSSLFGLPKATALFGSPNEVTGKSMELTEGQRRALLKEELKRQREEEKAAKLREYDAMFEQDARAQDAYYSQMLRKSRQKSEELLKSEQDYVGKGIMSNLPPDVATDRTEIIPDALKTFEQKVRVNKVDFQMELRNKLPSVDIDTNLEQMRSNKNPELEQSLEQIRANREEESAKVRALAAQNEQSQRTLIEKNDAAKLEAMETARAKRLANIEEIRLKKEQERFDRDMDFLDYLEKKEEKSRMMEEKAKIKFGISE